MRLTPGGRSRPGGHRGLGVPVGVFGLAGVTGLWPALAGAHSLFDGAGDLARWPVWLAALAWALSWLAHALGSWRQAPRGPILSGNAWLFHGAMLLGALALFGPLDAWAERSTAWHMVQHMVLIIGVAPLLVLARPLPAWRAAVGPVLDGWWRRLHQLSRHPNACALLHALAIWGWHAPGPYLAAVHDPLWHVLEHASFLFTGWLFWWSVLRPGRREVLPAALALVFTVTHTGLLGALLTFAPVPLYAAESRDLWDQQLAGLVMWVPGGVVYLFAALWAASRWLQSMERASAGQGAPLPHRLAGR